MPDNRINVLVHFVWATWNRDPIIDDGIERELHRYIQGICQDHSCPVVAVGGMPDHVHLIVSLTSTMNMATLMEFVKGGSSRFINKKEQRDWFKWQGSYGAFSVSPHEKTKVIDYIRNQKHHHADGSLWPNAERTEKPFDPH